MRALRAAGLTVLWILAGLGVVSGALWVATASGLIQPLIVVSGSMSPGIRTGDLVVSAPKRITAVAPGDIVTLRSTVSDKLVTHRVVTLSETSPSEYVLTLKGDANDVQDAETYRVVTDTVLSPVVVVPMVGRAVEVISRPAVALPLLIACAALVGLAALPPPRREEVTA